MHPLRIGDPARLHRTATRDVDSVRHLATAPGADGGSERSGWLATKPHTAVHELKTVFSG